MARSRLGTKGRRETEPFVALPRRVATCENWYRMSPYAVKLFIDLYIQFYGANNGDFTAAWSVMRKKGWRSRATLNRAIRELEWFGMIQLTRQGGRHRCSLYGVTFKPINECGGKLDVGETRVAKGTWSEPVAPFPRPPRLTAKAAKIIPLHRPAVHPAPADGKVEEVRAA